MLNFGFAGFRHGHVFSLYERVKNAEGTCIAGAFEENEPARKAAEEQGVVFNYASYEAMLSDSSIDVIAVGGAYGDRAEEAVLAAAQEIHRIDDMLSTGNPESEISKLTTVFFED